MTPEQTMQEEKKNENTKPRYNKDTELSELMEGVIDRPAGFSYKSGMQEVSEFLESNNVKIENCDPDFVKPVESDSPEVKRRYAIVTPYIMILEAWAEGVEIEYIGGMSEEWTAIHKPDNPEWCFGELRYRKRPENKATREEINAIFEKWAKIGDILPYRIFFVKHKTTNTIYPCIFRDIMDTVETEYAEDHLFFEKDTKCWVSWNQVRTDGKF